LTKVSIMEIENSKRLRFIVRRHEIKDGDRLTDEGYENAITIGDFQRMHDERITAFYHSPLERARQTAEGMLRGYLGEYDEPIDEQASAYLKISDRLKELDPPNPDNIKDRNAMFDYWFRNHWDSGSAQMKYSGRKVIDHLADIIYTHRAEEDGSIIENVTHAPNIESAVIQLIGCNPSLEEIGGCLNTGEAFSLNVDYGNLKEHQLVYQLGVSFRDKETEVPLDKVIPFGYKNGIPLFTPNGTCLVLI